MAITDALCEGDVLVFVPDAGWNWQGWNGKAKVMVSQNGVTADGKRVALKTDVEAMRRELTGKGYAADGFADIPGSVAVATIAVDDNALSLVSRVSGVPIARVAKTVGRYRCTVSPSQKMASSTIPDPVITKSGAIRVERHGAEHLKV